LARARKRSAADRFEREDMAFFERVRATYRERAVRYSNRYRLVNADQSVEGVWAEVQNILGKFLHSSLERSDILQ